MKRRIVVRQIKDNKIVSFTNTQKTRLAHCIEESWFLFVADEINSNLFHRVDEDIWNIRRIETAIRWVTQ